MDIYEIIDALTASSDLEQTAKDLGLSFAETNNQRPHLIVVEDADYWYVDLRQGMGFAAYGKADFSLDKAIEDQVNMWVE